MNGKEQYTPTNHFIWEDNLNSTGLSEVSGDIEFVGSKEVITKGKIWTVKEEARLSDNIQKSFLNMYKEFINKQPPSTIHNLEIGYIAQKAGKEGGKVLYIDPVRSEIMTNIPRRIEAYCQCIAFRMNEGETEFQLYVKIYNSDGFFTGNISTLNI